MLSKKDDDFLRIVRADPELGARAAELLNDLLVAQLALKWLTLKQRLKLITLATNHNMSHIRVTTYE